MNIVVLSQQIIDQQANELMPYFWRSRVAAVSHLQKLVLSQFTHSNLILGTYYDLLQKTFGANVSDVYFLYFFCFHA